MFVTRALAAPLPPLNSASKSAGSASAMSIHSWAGTTKVCTYGLMGCAVCICVALIGEFEAPQPLRAKLIADLAQPAAIRQTRHHAGDAGVDET